MAGKKKLKEPISGQWLKDVIKRRGYSVRAITNPKREGSIDYDIRTVQRAIKDNEITPQVLDAIAKAIDVYPDFLRGKYLWTLDLDIMRYPEVREHWLEYHLNPNLFPYCMYEQKNLGSRKHFMNTLLMHGVSEDDVVLDRFGYWEFSYNLSCLDSRRKRRSSYGHQG